MVNQLVKNGVAECVTKWVQVFSIVILAVVEMCKQKMTASIRYFYNYITYIFVNSASLFRRIINDTQPGLLLLQGGVF